MFRTLIATCFGAQLALLPAHAQDAAEIGDESAAIEATVEALYAVISGPVGAPRDYDALRALFMPGAAMGAVSPGETGEGRGRVFDVETYIERSGPFLVENGFVERSTRTEIEQWGHIAYVRSAYEGENSATGEVFLIGVNYLTLFKHEGEWKVASILWRTETEAWPIASAFGD